MPGKLILPICITVKKIVLRSTSWWAQLKAMFQETQKRGQNAYALYSAFTNYSTYADERNGYAIRNTKNDTRSVTMFNREQRVLEWTESKQFKELVAA